MATSDFLPFGTGAGANVLSQADYSALAARLAGFSSGVAKSVELNKVWRQSSIMSAVLAQFIVDETGLDAIDDGTLTTLLANLKSAIGLGAPGRLINVQEFSTAGAFTYTPTPGMKTVVIEVVGGGGAGGGTAATNTSQWSAGGGGAGGSYAKGRFTAADIGASKPVTIGAAGAKVNGAQGGSGGTTSVGALISAPGGVGGPPGAAFANSSTFITAGAPNNSIPSGGNIYNSGNTNGAIGIGVGGGSILSGYGGNSPLTGGGGGHSAGSADFNGFDANAPGAGGGGACQTGSSIAAAGGAGGAGCAIFWEYA